MEKQTIKSERNGKSLVILGFVSIAFLFLIYSKYQDPQLVTPDALGSFVRLSYLFYVGLFLSLGAISLGLYKFRKTKSTTSQTDLLAIISATISNSRAKKVFIITFITYGIFFSLTSGTLVYQPEVIFSYHYGVKVPSAQIIPCCDVPGYMPKILVYITEHIGLQIIPINLVLQIIVSYLVGLNMAIAVSAISISKKKRGVSGVGAATGLFIACPTCVGSFLSIFVGTASGIALSIALTQLQTLFISVSIPILLATPFILARKIKNSGVCKVD